MYRTMLKSKIHRATVTQADIHYVGSLTVDVALMEEADLRHGEQVDVVDIDNGARFTTYVIEGPRGSGVIGANGGAARLVAPGDLVVVLSYAGLSVEEFGSYRPRVVMVDEFNRVLTTGADPADAGAAPDLLRGDVDRSTVG